MPVRKKGVYFVDGFSPRADLVGIVSYLHEFAQRDVEHSRFYMVRGEQWGHREIDSQLVSVTYTEDRDWWLLGKRGEIVRISRSGAETESIPDAGTGPGRYGYLNKIVSIGGELYACGYRRQVYKRVGTHWSHVDDGILAPTSTRGVGFASMDGTGPNDIYAVGRKGEMFHFNGTKWAAIDLATNIKLESVRCVSSDLAYACGKNGTVLRGSGTSWELIQDDSFSGTLWAVEVFQGVPYLAHQAGLSRLVNNTLVPVETELDEQIGGYRLHASAGKLWSFGQDHIACFDGSEWELIVCPDNA